MISDGVCGSMTEAMSILDGNPSVPITPTATVAGSSSSGSGGSGSSSSNSSSNSSTSSNTTEPKDNPLYIKYFKMMKVGIPKEGAAQKMMNDAVVGVSCLQDGIDILENKLPQSSSSSSSSTITLPSQPQPNKYTGPKIAVSEHPKYAKYFKMLKVGLPAAAVVQKMIKVSVVW